MTDQVSNPFESSETFVEEEIEATPDAAQVEFDKGLAETIRSDAGVEESPEMAKLIAGLTEDELKVVFDKARQVDDINERLTKTHDRVFGKIGQLEQSFKQLSETKQPVEQHQPVEITKENLANLSEYFEDEAVIEAFVKDLNKINFGGSHVVQQAPEIDFTPVNDQLTEIKNTFETKLLYLAHPDWFELTVKEYDENKNPVYTDDFIAWKQSLPPEGREILDTSADGLVLAKAYTEFKNWRAKKADFADKKKQRLEASVRPSGVGSSNKQELQAESSFKAGLRSVLGT